MATEHRAPYFDPQQNFRNTGSVDYPQHRLYVSDTVVLKTDSRRAGLVARTHDDVDSFFDFDERIAVKCNKVPKRNLHHYESTGIPPRRIVIVSWVPGSDNVPDYEMLREGDVQVIDREICIGDVVKLDPEDAMSGVVIDATVRTNLREPQRWPLPSSSNTEGQVARQLQTVLDVNVIDLKDTLDVNVHRLIYYKGWIGRIVDFEQSIKLRLSDGSVIDLKDPEDVTIAGYDDDDDDDDETFDPLVGDLLKTKKGNLRRGRAIFGQYNANVEPVGYVAETVVEYAHIDWLQAKPPRNDFESTPGMPPASLEQNELEQAIIYGSQQKSLKVKRRGLEVGAGDKVRLRDAPSMLSRRPDLIWIPRQETLGFDTNVYTVLATFTMVKIQWQDNRITDHPSIALVPIMDFDDDDDVWPGELVTSRASRIEDGVRTPNRVGIVQSVKSRDRIAKVRWFEGTMSFFETQEKSLMPGSWTGPLASVDEEVSLYDIWTEPGIARRLGDFVAIIPPFGSAADASGSSSWRELPRYSDVTACLEQPSDHQDWFGEVVELSLDGHLTLHLGSSTEPREVRVPWECTTMAYSADFESDESDESGVIDDEEEEDEMDNVVGSVTVPSFLRHHPAAQQWMDEQGRPLEDAQVDEGGWSTDDEGNDDVEMHDTSKFDAESRAAANQEFSYQSMMELMSAREVDTTVMENFKILEGEPPNDHHFKSHSASHLNGQRLRRVQKEHRILRSSLPAGVLVRTWESALHLLRILIVGPLETPYEYAPFVIDMLLDDKFPSQPPQTFFHSWTDGSGPVNPNLYEDGKICLSLLGTWPGDNQNDTWSTQATILQVLVSLLGLVLVKDPYYNEAGFEVRAGSKESKVPSAVYAERSFLKSREFIARAVEHPSPGFEQELRALYLEYSAESPQLLARAVYDAVAVIHKVQGRNSGSAPSLDINSSGSGRIMSAGAIIPLRRTVNKLLDQLGNQANMRDAASRLREFMKPSSSAEGMPSLETLLVTGG